MSADGHRLVTASMNNVVTYWDLPNRVPLTTYQHDGPMITEVALEPTGSHVATAHHDGTARIWNTDTGKELAVLVHGSGRAGVVLPDGSYRAG